MPTPPTGKPLGRPPGSSPLLTPELTAEICKALELLVPEKYAAEANGIDEDTFHSWMRKGAAGIEPYTEFRQAVTRARAKAVANMHVRAIAGGKGSQQATWFLERRLWREYAQHQRIDVAPVDEFDGMSEAELGEVLAQQRQRVAAFDALMSEDESE